MAPSCQEIAEGCAEHGKGKIIEVSAADTTHLSEGDDMFGASSAFSYLPAFYGSSTSENERESIDMTPRTPPSAMSIPSRSPIDTSRQRTHTQGSSSVGSSSAMHGDFEFFAPSSFASHSTAPTSFMGSPHSSFSFGDLVSQNAASREAKGKGKAAEEPVAEESRAWSEDEDVDHVEVLGEMVDSFATLPARDERAAEAETKVIMTSPGSTEPSPTEAAGEEGAMFVPSLQLPFMDVASAAANTASELGELSALALSRPQSSAPPGYEPTEETATHEANGIHPRESTNASQSSVLPHYTLVDGLPTYADYRRSRRTGRRLRTALGTAAVSSRFVPSGIARRLQPSSTPTSSTIGGNEDPSHQHAQGALDISLAAILARGPADAASSSTHAETRRGFVRSESSPDLFGRRAILPPGSYEVVSPQVMRVNRSFYMSPRRPLAAEAGASSASSRFRADGSHSVLANLRYGRSQRTEAATAPVSLDNSPAPTPASSRPVSRAGSVFSGGSSFRFPRTASSFLPSRRGMLVRSQTNTPFASGSVTPDIGAPRTRPRHSRNFSMFNLPTFARSRRDSVYSEPGVAEHTNIRSDEMNGNILGVSPQPGESTSSTSPDVGIEEMSGDPVLSRSDCVSGIPSARYPSLADVARPTILRNASRTHNPAVSVSFESSGPFGTFSSFHRSGPSRDLFDRLLPRELRLAVMKALVWVHEEDHESSVRNGTFRGRRAKETRWTGRESAVRELVRLSRVSKTWQSLVLDGQLWRRLDISPFPDISERALVAIAQSAGPFVAHLDLSGLDRLPSAVLLALVRAHTAEACHLQLAVSARRLSETRLTTLSLSNCRSVSTPALHELLHRSPSLVKVDLSDVPAVIDDTCALLGTVATTLEDVKLDRCNNMSGKGLKWLLGDATRTSRSESKIRRLSCVALKGIESELMSQVGACLPVLNMLNLGYSDVDNEAVAKLVQHPDPASFEGDIEETAPTYVELTSHQAGFDTRITHTHYRRILPLRHIVLTGCASLTDRACASLAHAVPMLEILEMANVGPSLADDGLVRLFETTPLIRRIDIEGASEITDAVLEALTPAAPSPQTATNTPRRVRHRQMPQVQAALNRGLPGPVTSTPGTQLTHLIVSHATELTQEALLLLTQRCSALVHLEADDTQAGDALARDFITRQRSARAKSTYLSLIDCRNLGRSTCTDLASAGSTRPREGQRGYAFAPFAYDDADLGAIIAARSSSGVMPEGFTTASSSTQYASTAANHRAVQHVLGLDECDDRRVTLKSFWGWQSLDTRAKVLRKEEAKARKASRRAQSALGAASPDGARWERLTTALLHDEGEDARGCTIA